MRLKIGLDVDNTITSSINSDYLIYKKTCQSLGLPHRSKEEYLEYRTNGNLIGFLDYYSIDKSSYFAKRYEIAQNEEYLKIDEAILDFELFKELQKYHDVFIISKRRNIKFLQKQIKDLGININPKNIFITFDLETGRFNSKENLIKSLELDYYVGDSHADLQSTLNTNTCFALVNTGFNKDISYEKNFQDINAFFKCILNESFMI